MLQEFVHYKFTREYIQNATNLSFQFPNENLSLRTGKKIRLKNYLIGTVINANNFVAR